MRRWESTVRDGGGGAASQKAVSFDRALLCRGFENDLRNGLCCALRQLPLTPESLQNPWGLNDESGWGFLAAPIQFGQLFHECPLAFIGVWLRNCDREICTRRTYWGECVRELVEVTYRCASARIYRGFLSVGMNGCRRVVSSGAKMCTYFWCENSMRAVRRNLGNRGANVLRGDQRGICYEFHFELRLNIKECREENLRQMSQSILN